MSTFLINRIGAMSEPIEVLKGAALTSVEFVHDYVQLRFDDIRLTVNAPFDVLLKGKQ